ncbi:hypothetical protein [Paenibacillus sp. JGP012]|nr:hypothetical protein [Paenibacillus sp. JGP012]
MVILLDEQTSALDPELVGEVLVVDRSHIIRHQVEVISFHDIGASCSN